MADSNLNSIGAVEAGLVAQLTAALATAKPTCHVAVITRNDFGNDGELVLQLPAARVRFNATAYTNTIANSYNQAYRVAPQFDVLCADENLASESAQAQASLAIADAVVQSLAGVPVTLADGTTTEPCAIVGMSRFLDDECGMVYVVTVEVKGLAQFTPAGGAA